MGKTDTATRNLALKPQPLPGKTDTSSPVIISSDNIILGRKLGEGAHGAVHEATYVKGEDKVGTKLRLLLLFYFINYHNYSLSFCSFYYYLIHRFHTFLSFFPLPSLL